MIISCSLSVVLLMDEGEPVFLLDRDGEAAGTFSRHSPEGRTFGMTDQKENASLHSMDGGDSIRTHFKLVYTIYHTVNSRHGIVNDSDPVTRKKKKSRRTSGCQNSVNFHLLFLIKPELPVSSLCSSAVLPPRGEMYNCRCYRELQ